MPSPAPPPQLFDRALIASRLDRAIRAASGEGADFLLRRAADELNERLSVVSREFAVAGDVGTPGPHAAEVLAARRGGGVTLRLAPTRLSAGEGNFLRAIGDVERLPLTGHSFDLIVSLLALHHVNDLPGALIQMRHALRPGGLLLASLPALGTLDELRRALTEAEAALTGGAAPRVSPFPDLRDCAGLLQRAGYALPVADVEVIRLRYADPLALLDDLRAAGETNAVRLRDRRIPPRALFPAALGALPVEDGRITATLRMAVMTGWAPEPAQR